MDILHLVDRLEELFNESRNVPFTHSVIVDEDRMLDIIDQLLAQRDRILAQSQEEANRTLQLAREKSEQLVERDSVSQAAYARSEQIVAQGRAEAERQKIDADDYVLDTLERLEVEMEKLLTQVRNGVRALQSEVVAEVVEPPLTIESKE